jgi:hypothetical protein
MDMEKNPGVRVEESRVMDAPEWPPFHLVYRLMTRRTAGIMQTVHTMQASHLVG